MTWHQLEVVPPDGTSVSVTVDGIALIVGSEAGVWWAIEDRCSHAGCAFSTDGEVDGFTAVCNCHGSEFHVRSGEVLRSPASLPLRTFGVRRTAAGVEVELP